MISQEIKEELDVILKDNDYFKDFSPEVADFITKAIQEKLKREYKSPLWMGEFVRKMKWHDTKWEKPEEEEHG